jgi:hypothetical protein
MRIWQGVPLGFERKGRPIDYHAGDDADHDLTWRGGRTSRKGPSGKRRPASRHRCATIPTTRVSEKTVAAANRSGKIS